MHFHHVNFVVLDSIILHKRSLLYTLLHTLSTVYSFFLGMKILVELCLYVIELRTFEIYKGVAPKNFAGIFNSDLTAVTIFAISLSLVEPCVELAYNGTETVFFFVFFWKSKKLDIYFRFDCSVCLSVPLIYVVFIK